MNASIACDTAFPFSHVYDSRESRKWAQCSGSSNRRRCGISHEKPSKACATREEIAEEEKYASRERVAGEAGVNESDLARQELPGMR